MYPTDASAWPSFHSAHPSKYSLLREGGRERERDAARNKKKQLKSGNLGGSPTGILLRLYLKTKNTAFLLSASTLLRLL